MSLTNAFIRYRNVGIVDVIYWNKTKIEISHIVMVIILKYGIEISLFCFWPVLKLVSFIDLFTTPMKSWAVENWRKWSEDAHWRPSLCLAVLCFYSKTGYCPSYCQISTDLDKILHTPIVVWNTLVANLDRDWRLGGSRPNQNHCFL